jgi:S-(hydroxymethyl)glutathione dehydrogenase/alcohol dehydrogenase
VVLGHEGAGIVRETGPGVTRTKPGDHVVLCWAPACGVCPSCAAGHAVLCDRLDRTTYRNRLPSGATRLHARGQDLGQFLSTACFADHVVVAEEGAVVVGRDGSGESDLRRLPRSAVLSSPASALSYRGRSGGREVVVIARAA